MKNWKMKYIKINLGENKHWAIFKETQNYCNFHVTLQLASQKLSRNNWIKKD